jgi:hypothetical protein
MKNLEEMRKNVALARSNALEAYIQYKRGFATMGDYGKAWENYKELDSELFIVEGQAVLSLL